MTTEVAAIDIFLETYLEMSDSQVCLWWKDRSIVCICSLFDGSVLTGYVELRGLWSFF